MCFHETEVSHTLNVEMYARVCMYASPRNRPTTDKNACKKYPNSNNIKNLCRSNMLLFAQHIGLGQILFGNKFCQCRSPVKISFDYKFCQAICGVEFSTRS